MNRTAMMVFSLSLLLRPQVAQAGGRNGNAGPNKGSPSGKRSHTWYEMGFSGGRLGAQISSMTEQLRDFFGAPSDAGVLVARVEPDSPAAKAGIKVGDVLVEVDGDKMDGPQDVVNALGTKGSGAKVSMVVIREKRRQTLTASLRDAPTMKGMLGGGIDGDFDVDIPQLGKDHGMRFFSFNGDEIEKLTKQLEELERRLDKLEKRTTPK